jgi:hypothetical protein
MLWKAFGREPIKRAKTIAGTGLVLQGEAIQKGSMLDIGMVLHPKMDTDSHIENLLEKSQKVYVYVTIATIHCA